MFKSGISQFLSGWGKRDTATSRKRSSMRSVVPAAVESLESRVLLAAATVVSGGAVPAFDSTFLSGNVIDDGGAEVTERGVVIAKTSENSDPEIGQANTVQLVMPTAGLGVYVLNATGLDPATQYSFKFYAINADGTAYSAVETVSTLNPDDLIVTTTDDVVDSNDGVISLREAIELANSTIGADAITFGGAVFTDGTPDTITLTNGQLAITDSVTITGTGADLLTVSGNNSSRVFYLYNRFANINVLLSGMTITGGNETLGGGITTIDEDLTIEDCVITGNTSSGKGGGLWADGFNMDLTIRRTIISNNTAGIDGGGIYVEDTGGLLTIEDTTISGNNAGDDGGGIYFYDPDASVVIRNTTISGNTAVELGGGIYLYDTDGGTFTIENCTISGNQAAVGGGLFLYGPDNAFTIRNSTITNNTANLAGGIYVYQFYPTFNVINSIIAGNNAPGETRDFMLKTPLTLGNVENNIFGALAAGTLNSAASDVGNQVGVDPLLSPLADNGGFTQTHAIAANSPARNGGNAAVGTTSDQRGNLRGDPPDIGAFELLAPVLTNLEASPLYFVPGQAPTAVTSTLTVDALQTISGATVQVSAGFQIGDTLSFSNTPNITGVFNPSARTLTLTGVDTAANYQAALRSVTYGTSSQSPAVRTVTFQVTDGVESSESVSRDVGGFAQLQGSQLLVFGTDLIRSSFKTSVGVSGVARKLR